MENKDKRGFSLTEQIGRNYFKMGLTAFLVVGACLLLFFLLFRINGIMSFLGDIFHIIQPIIIGFVIAYLVNPIFNFSNKHLTVFFKKLSKKPSKFPEKIARVMSIIIALLVLLIAVILLLYLVLPQLYSSITKLISEIPTQIDRFNKYIHSVSEKDDYLSAFIISLVDYVTNWIEKELPLLLKDWAGYFASGVMSTISVVGNSVIGVVVAVYLLNRKEIFIAQLKKSVCALFSERASCGILGTAKITHNVFSKYINGQIVDSLIVGILCFIGCTFLKMPYSMLVSAVICLTNIIPVFGPYIGGIPCTIIIALTDPIKGLYFAIFIILLQCLDGNIIAPKIIGESTGLNSFWVIFAITLGGGLFGVAGMVISAPLFAVIYKIIKSIVESNLEKKGLPVETSEYMG